MKHLSLLSLLCLSFLVSSFCYAYEKQEIPLVVIIRSYENDKDLVEKNLSSFFEQDYENFRIIYINDASTKDTMKFARDITARYHQEHRVTFIDNKERQGSLSNVYAAMHSLADHEVAIIWDGDDWCYDKNALNIFNKHYSDENVWVTFGHYVAWPSGEPGHAEPFPDNVIAENSFRSYRLPNKRGILPVTATRACRSWLFKSLPLESFLYTNPIDEDMYWMDTFYPMAEDYSYMVPMLEKAGFHHKCILDITYVYNLTNPISDARVNRYLQARCVRHSLAHKPFQPIQNPIFIEDRKATDTVALVLLSNNAPEKMFATLNDLRAKITPFTEFVVLYQADDFTESRYQRIASQLKNVTCIPCSHQNVGHVMHAALASIKSNYVLLANDNSKTERTIEIYNAMMLLKKTQTNLFYYALDENRELFMQPQLPLVNLERTVCAWYPTNKVGDWEIPVINLALWNRTYLQSLIAYGACSSLTELCNDLQKQTITHKTLGLLYQHKQI